MKNGSEVKLYLPLPGLHVGRVRGEAGLDEALLDDPDDALDDVVRALVGLVAPGVLTLVVNIVSVVRSQISEHKT